MSRLTPAQVEKIYDTLLDIADIKVKGREQEIIDVMFQIAITVHKNPNFFKDIDHLTEWIRQHYKALGFKLTPAGLSHGVLEL